jgi:hypothetical protein
MKLNQPKIPQELVYVAEFIGKYFEVYDYSVTTKNRWALIVRGLRGDLLEIFIDPFDVKNQEHLGHVMEKVAEAITNYKDSGLII